MFAVEGAYLSLRRGRRYLLQFSNQRREILTDDFPENIEVHVVVAVDEAVTQADNLHPQDTSILCPLIGRDSTRRFPDDSSNRTKERLSGRSISKSARVLPRAICAASRAALSM